MQLFSHQFISNGSAYGEEIELSLAEKIIFWVFAVFLIVKAILFDLQFYNYIKRYKETYQTWNQVEIWIMLLTAVKITILIPDYFVKNINWIFWIFATNSAVTFWLSHVLHMRAIMARKATVCAARSIIALFAIRLLLLFVILVVGPVIDRVLTETKYYNLLLECQPGNPYPFRFLLIFSLDFLSASIDFIILWASPKTFSPKQRLKEARVAEID